MYVVIAKPVYIWLFGFDSTCTYKYGSHVHAHMHTHTVSEDRITDWHSLESYLRTEEDKEQWLLRGSPDLASSPGSGYWYGRQPGEHTSTLRKYHVSTRYGVIGTSMHVHYGYC